MAQFLAVTVKGDEWVTLVNLDYVVRIDPYAIKDKPAAMLTLSPGDKTLVVQEDFNMLASMVEAIRA